MHGIEFGIAEDEVVDILWHNGMGKSTLLKTLMVFLPVASGEIRFHGHDIIRIAPNERA